MANARLLICLLGISGALALPSSRILEGDDATSGQFPYVSSIRLDNAHTCVGNIISQHYILTAGHCVSQMGTTPYDAARVTARVGSINQYAGGSIVGVEAITIFPSYGNFLHDIALLKLKTPLVWSDKVKHIELADENTEITDKTEIVVSGWGLQADGASPYKLQHTKMHALDHSECEYRAGYGYESVLCLDHAEKQGICRGDDGAGAVAHDRLVGVFSFAFGSCGTKYPDIASKVSFYREWIHSIIN